eukprot:1160517-Pelagomonas_calceolata.AAC.16
MTAPENQLVAMFDCLMTSWPGNQLAVVPDCLAALIPHCFAYQRLCAAVKRAQRYPALGCSCRTCNSVVEVRAAEAEATQTLKAQVRGCEVDFGKGREVGVKDGERRGGLGDGCSLYASFWTPFMLSLLAPPIPLF